MWEIIAAFALLSIVIWSLLILRARSMRRDGPIVAIMLGSGGHTT